MNLNKSPPNFKRIKMIQRIQSIFLLLAAAAFFSLFGLDFASSNAEVSGFLSDKAFDIQDHIALTILAALGGALALLTIFLFNNRQLQIKLGYGVILLAIALPIVAVALFYGQFNALPTNIKLTYGIGLAAPILALIFTGLANRFINKDEKLVRSMDRLR